MRALLLYFALLLFHVAGEKSCEERCCNNKDDKKGNKKIINTAKLQGNSSSCIKKCLHSKGLELNNMTKGHGCEYGKEKRDVIDKNPTENVTKKIACSDLVEYPMATNDFVTRPEDIKIHFKRQETDNHTYDYANITWKMLTTTDKSKNWTHYVVLWTSGPKRVCHYGLVPKNQSFFLIDLSSNLFQYEFPNAILFNVYTYPLKQGDPEYYVLSEFGTRIPSLMAKATFPSKTEITTSLMAAIIVGSCVGVALIIAVTAGWKFHFRVNGPRDIWRVYWSQSGERPSLPSQTIDEKECQVYLSYFNEDDQFMKIIIAIVQTLTDLGYDVLMDKMYTNEQVDEGPARWAQTHIASSSKVIVICSPRYVEICQLGKTAVRNSIEKNEETRVWFEIEIISNIYTKIKSASKIICLWMNDGDADGLPPWMGVTYTWPQDLDKILKRLKSPNRNGKTPSATSTSKRIYSYSVNDDVFET